MMSNINIFMKIVLFVCCLLLLNIDHVHNLPLNDTNYIIGGWTTSGPYPYLVELRNANGGHSCGGSIYNSYWVITAGHCVGAPYAAVGVHIRSKKTSYQSVHKVVKSIRHPSYKLTGGPDGAMTNDIGLLKLATPIDFKSSNGKLYAISMPKQGQSFGGELRTVGWGKDDSGGYSDTLHAVNVPVVSDGSCANSYGGYFDKHTMFCAGSPGKDSCGGDSGGPLFKVSKEQITLVGITSWGKGCGKRGYPGIYTRVASYVDWIKANAK